MDMEHAISMEEILEPFWDLLPPPEQPLVTSSSVTDGVVTHGDGEGGDIIDESATEWTFEKLLEEDLLTNTTPPVANSSCSTLNVDPVVEVNHGAIAPPVVSTVGDPMEYNSILKRKLEEDLAAFKMWKAASVVDPECSQGSNNQIGGRCRNLVRNKFNGENSINPAQNADLRVRLATSSSSRDPSPSEDDLDGEVEILGFKMPTEERMRKRKESNRESARRSRYRKAAHLKELEDQVEQLKSENSCLLRSLAALNQKYNDANVDNRVLKADMETLRAKVKMGEDSLKRVLEMTSLPSIPTSAPTSSDASVPIQDNIVNYFTTPADDYASIDNSFMPTAAPFPLQAEVPTIISETMNTTTIDQITTHCAGAMELIHETMRAMPTSPGYIPQESFEPLGPNETINMDIY